MPLFSSKKSKAKKAEAAAAKAEGDDSGRAPSDLADDFATTAAESILQEGGDPEQTSSSESAASPVESRGQGYDGSSSIDFSGRGSNGNSGAIVVHGANRWGATKGEKSMVRRAAQDVAVAAVSAGLIAGGISSVIAPVVAVVIVVGHVAVRGVTRLVERRVKVRVDQQEHLEQVHLTQANAADHLTMVINGVWSDEGDKHCYNAFLSPNDDPSYAQVNSGHLTGLSKLIGGSMKCNVRDMAGFTELAQKPFGVRLSMPDLLALIRQSWEYERFAETKCGTMTVIVIKAQRGNTKLRVAWNNHGDLNASEAMVYTEREWKKTSYSGKTKNMPDGFADVDVTLDRSLIFV